MEQDFHRVNLDQSLDQCLRKNIGPHKITEKSIKWENDFIDPKTSWKTFLIILGWSLPFSMFNFDLYTDVFLVDFYRKEKLEHEFIQTRCLNDKSAFIDDDHHTRNQCDVNPLFVDELMKYPDELSTMSVFYYSLVFLLLPISSYLVEWILHNKSEFHQKLAQKVCTMYKN